MFGSRWVITPSWFSGSWRYFCILLCILNIFCFFQVHTISVLYCAHVCMKYSLCISVFLEEISSLSHSIVFHYLWVDRWGRLAILWNSAFKWVYLSFSPLPLASLLFSAICKGSSDNHFVSIPFFFLRMVLITTSCTMSWTSVHSSSGTPSNLIPWIYVSLHVYAIVIQFSCREHSIIG